MNTAELARIRVFKTDSVYLDQQFCVELKHYDGDGTEFQWLVPNPTIGIAAAVYAIYLGREGADIHQTLGRTTALIKSLS